MRFLFVLYMNKAQMATTFSDLLVQLLIDKSKGQNKFTYPILNQIFSLFYSMFTLCIFPIFFLIMRFSNLLPLWILAIIRMHYDLFSFHLSLLIISSLWYDIIYTRKT
jgi:hypothetical protein